MPLSECMAHHITAFLWLWLLFLHPPITSVRPIPKLWRSHQVRVRNECQQMEVYRQTATEKEASMATAMKMHTQLPWIKYKF